MATFTFTGSDLCSGGEHFTLAVSGDVTATRRLGLDDFRQLDGVDQELLMRLLRIHFQGSTKGQIKAALASGVTITI